MASGLAARSVWRNEERQSACCPAIVPPQARARYIRRMVDHADTLHHYMRLLRPDALDGCEREHRFAPPTSLALRSGVACGQRLAVEVDGGRWTSRRRAARHGWRTM